MKSKFRFSMVLWLFACSAVVADNVPIQEAIRAGNLQEARELISTIPNPDPWWGKLALAQLEEGDRQSATSSLRNIKDFGELKRASQAVAATAKGGATGADFDSLINLITTTVEPDSWDVVGGLGTVTEFPGGVEVDSRGVLRNRYATNHAKHLDLIRNTAMGKDGTSASAHKRSPLRMVSLPRLERELLLNVALGEEPTDTMKHLAGIYELQYIFLFPESNDVVIAGPADSWETNDWGQSTTSTGRPVLLLEDLVTLLRNAREQHGKFGCSIDPKQEALANTREFLAKPTGPLRPTQTRRWVKKIREHLGMQNVRVFGVAPSSHVAKVIVEADYHMKLVGMGLEESPGDMKGYLDSITVDSIPESMDVLRWWFTIAGSPLVQNASGTAFQFVGNTVKLQSENERLAANGKRSHTGKSSELNQVLSIDSSTLW